MASQRVLITGGEGFIGRHLARALVAQGSHVISLDALIGQVHGKAHQGPSDGVEFIKGDVRDREAVGRALSFSVDAVVHLAADVGVGQSMYAIERYVSVNDLGTAVLLEALARHPVRKLVVASSMSVYGEGLYRARDGRLVETAVRRLRQGDAGADPLDEDGIAMEPVPTPEAKRPDLASVYALTKYSQERMCLIVGEAYGIATTALRLFNVYGPGQALEIPTRVCSPFLRSAFSMESGLSSSRMGFSDGTSCMWMT